MLTNVSSGTSLVFDPRLPCAVNLVRSPAFQVYGAGIPVQIGGVTVGAYGVTYPNVAISDTHAQGGVYGVARPGEFVFAQVPHHGQDAGFTPPGPGGQHEPVTVEEYELYISEEDAEGHTDLRIMRNQFLEDLAERRLTEQEYLARTQNPYVQPERDVPKIETQPGTRMLEFSTILFSRRARDLVVEPIIADYRIDMDEALAQGAGKWKLRAIQAHYWIAYIVGFLDEVLPVLGRLWRALRGS
jgi:hypothetical protein